MFMDASYKTKKSIKKLKLVSLVGNKNQQTVVLITTGSISRLL